MNADKSWIQGQQQRGELNAISFKIIGAAYKVNNTLGVGFLEKVYENALCWEIRKCSLEIAQQIPVPVIYDGREVGNYVPDLIVAGRIVVEVKATEAADNVYRAQCINYLRATGLKLCLLLNFGRERLRVARFALKF
jgi:GxxExxY protein